MLVLHSLAHWGGGGGGRTKNFLVGLEILQNLPHTHTICTSCEVSVADNELTHVGRRERERERERERCFDDCVILHDGQSRISCLAGLHTTRETP